MPRPITYPNVFGTLSGQVSASLLDQDFNAAGSAINDSASGWCNAALDTGSVNSYVVTLSPPPASYTNGFLLYFIALNTNTGPSSINVNLLGNIQIVGSDGSALAANTIIAGTLYGMVCVNNAFRIVSPSVTVGVSSVGDTKLWWASTPPVNWLFLQGQAISRSTYATLFALLGTAYGTGDGSTTFNLPDLRGRSPMGSGTGTGLTARTLGQQLGEENHPLTTTELAAHLHAITISDPTHNHATIVTNPSHNHGLSDPGHTHTITISDPSHQHTYFSPIVIGVASGSAAFASNGASAAFTGSSTTGISATANLVSSNTGVQPATQATTVSNQASGTGITASETSVGSGTAHNTIHPVTVCNFIIRVL